MAWIYLLAAGVCEIVWAAGLKKYGFTRTWGGALTVLVMLLSFVLLDRAMRTLPLGTAYVVWTGTGAVGSAALGMMMFGEPRGAVRIACIGLIVAGILGLRWSTPEPAHGGITAPDGSVEAHDASPGQ
jgi:quaternary ammonium compound-resistance protein SugE